jgi:hypothetical protein
MAGPTITWGLPNDPRISPFTGTALVNSAVNSGDSFTPTMSDTDDFAVAIHITGAALVAADRGPFAIAADVARGSDTFDVGSGVGSKFTAGDMALFRNSAGNEVFRAGVESVSTDTITLDDRIFVALDTTFTVEIPGKITVTGDEGAGSGQTPVSRTSTLWLVDMDQKANWLVTRWRFDANASLTINTTGFTATTLLATEFIDMLNFYRSDRNTRRTLMAAVQGTPVAAPGNVFSYPWLSHASGHPPSRTGAAATMERYAESHPPARLQVDIKEYVNNGTPQSVIISGFKTVWSPIKSAIAGSGGGGTDQEVVIPIENWNQFQINDAVTLHNLANGNQDNVTINAKTFAGSATGQPTLGFSAIPVNDYAVDDVIGILATETIAAPAANGTLHSAEAWCFPLKHYTSGVGGDDSYDYEIFSSIQGVFGCLMSADKRLRTDLGTDSELGHLPIIQNILNSSFGSAATAIGMIGGVLSIPRARAASAQNIRIGTTAGTSRALWQTGIVDKFGRAATGACIIYGRSSATNSPIVVRSGASNAEITTGTMSIPSKGTGGADVGGPTIAHQEGCVSFKRNLLAMQSNLAKSSTSNSSIRDAYATFDRMQGNQPDRPTAGVQTYLVVTPTQSENFANLVTTNDPTVGVNFLTGSDFTGADEILRLKDVNSSLISGAGDLSHRVRFRQFVSTEFTAALVDSYMRRFVVDFNNGAQNKTRTLQSRHTLNVQVIDETGEPLEGVSVVLVDNSAPGSPQVDTTTGFDGRIAASEVVSHTWAVLSEIADIDIPVTQTSGFPTGITYTDFNPFQLIVAPVSGTMEGLVPAKLDFDLPPFLPTPLNFVIVLHSPRPDGQFGDAGFGEF